MPGYKGHLTGGFVAFIALLFVMKQYHNPSMSTMIEWLSCTLAGSLFPDIDIKSKGQKWLYWVLFALFLCLFVRKSYCLLSLLGIVALVPMLVNHRGLFHKPWFMVALPASVALAVHCSAPHYFPLVARDALFFCGGALSHLWLDLGLRRMLRLRW